MCGICGAASLRTDPDKLERLTKKAVGLFRHRGPDGQGVWADPAGLALGHARLSILDLSTAASQPMLSGDGRWALSYNGEIYNFQELGQELENLGVQFKSSSDTEVLLEGIARWGLERTLGKLVGMFAFAAWDRKNRKLFLVRDRLGQKPLFYGTTPETFLFGSELRVVKAFDAHPQVDPEACALMLRYKSVPAPFTIYKNFFKLMPGHWVEFDLSTETLGTPRQYWQPRPSSEPADRKELSFLLAQAVRDRLVSDVPLGAFLSGGIDSSLVVAMMQKMGGEPVKTFTIGFAQSEYDEAKHAAAVAQHLRTEHTELRVTPQELLDVVPQLPGIYDEPFGDSSQIPTVLVSRLARERVTVALSGDGGDEGFAGYNRHHWLPRILHGLSRCPEVVLQALLKVLGLQATEDLLCWLSTKGLLPVRMVKDKIDKLRGLLQCRSYPELYRQALSDTMHPERFLATPVRGWIEESPWAHPENLLHQACLADLSFYLPNDILVKVDRATMSCGLEARSPFLDHRLLEYALSLPQDWKIDKSGGKLILRTLLAEHLPAELFERPKMGFAVPLAQWLKTDLREWAEGLLSSDSWHGLLREQAVRQVWQEHQSGRRRHHHLLWNILMLLAWLEENCSSGLSTNEFGVGPTSHQF